jgi:predicted MFS family arabinose efflux permease
MQSEMHFSNAMAGYLAAGNYFGYLVGAVLAGSVPWIRRRRLLGWRISVLLSIVTTGLMAAAANPWAWFCLRTLSGIASGLVFVLAASMVLDILAKHDRPKLSGMMYGGVGGGIAASGWLVPVLARHFGWRGTWVGLMGITVIVGAAAVLWMREESVASNPSRAGDRPRVSMGQRADQSGYFPWLMAAYGCEGLGYIITGTFLVAMATRLPALHGFASYCWVLVGLAALPSAAVWSYFGGRVGEVSTLVTAYLLQAAGVLLTVLVPNAIGVYLGSILFGGTFMGITTLGTMLGRELRPQDSSKAIGVMTVIYGIGQIVGAGAAGALANRSGGFELPTLAAAGVLVIGAGLLVLGRRARIPLVTMSRQSKHG